jgi:hypothetical protein
VAVLSLYVQKNRIYLPIIMGLGVLGIGSMWVGIQQFLAHSKEDPPGWTKRLLARVEKLPAQVVAWLERDRLPIRLLVAAVLVACMSLWQSDTLGFHEQHNRTTAPDPDVREQLAAFDLDCVYSNNQFWLVWETDLTVMEAPRKPSDIAKYGPERCRHFVFDRRHRRKPYERYLKRKATELYRGKNYVLYELPR